MGKRASRSRVLFYVRGLVVLGLLLGLALWPIPWIVFSPSAPRPIDALVEIRGASQESSGELLASSAGFRQATPGLALWALVDGSRDLERFADGNLQRQVTETSLQLSLSVMAAAVVGLSLAGQTASVTSDGLLVVGVAPDDPAAAVLRPGDELLAAAGEPLVLPSDLEGLASESSSGDVLPILRRRDGREELVDVPVHVTATRRRVEATTVPLNASLRLPPEVHVSGIELEAVGGSAGLMLALAVHDRFAPTPVLRGRTITGTGSIDRHGRVFPIQGIRQKVIAAEAAGVDIFLAPARQFDEAAGAADRLTVISVATVQEAIAALRTSTTG